MNANDFGKLSAENREHRLAHQTIEEQPIEHARNAAEELRETGATLGTNASWREDVGEIPAEDI
jgi:hypothetical protein